MQILHAKKLFLDYQRSVLENKLFILIFAYWSFPNFASNILLRGTGTLETTQVSCISSSLD